MTSNFGRWIHLYAVFELQAPRLRPKSATARILHACDITVIKGLRFTRYAHMHFYVSVHMLAVLSQKHGDINLSTDKSNFGHLCYSYITAVANLVLD